MYLVFSGEFYYAKGGMNDYQGEFHTLEEAREFAHKLTNETHMCSHDWYQIVDSEYMQVVEQSEEQAYGND